jgi:hypothetical protein
MTESVRLQILERHVPDLIIVPTRPARHAVQLWFGSVLPVLGWLTKGKDFMHRGSRMMTR